MSRVRFHQIKSISKLCEVIWSGPGWDNYNDNQSISKNIFNLYPNNKLPDMVITFDHRPIIGFNQTSIPKCIMMNEMHSPDGNRQSALDLIVKQQYDLVICHHLNEMNNPFFSSIRNRCYNISHCADNSIFKDYQQKKEIDVLVCGNIKFDKYVLRRRYPAIIDKLNAMKYNCKIYKHPGGFHNDSYTDKYLIDFAKMINKSKICLTCSSVYKCAFGKYVEIPMCRSLLAGDLPDERKDFFNSFMLVLNATDTDEIIINKISSQLQNNLDTYNKIELGYQLNHNNFTMQNYAKKFLNVVTDFLFRRSIL